MEEETEKAVGTEKEVLLEEGEKKKPRKLMIVTVLILIAGIVFSVYFFWPETPPAPELVEEPEAVEELTKGEKERLIRCQESPTYVEFLPKCKATLYDDVSFCSDMVLGSEEQCRISYFMVKAASTGNLSYCEMVPPMYPCKFMTARNMDYCPAENLESCEDFLNFDAYDYTVGDLTESEKKELDEKLGFYAFHNKDVSVCEKINNSVNSIYKRAPCLIMQLSEVQDNFCEEMLIEDCMNLPEGVIIGTMGNASAS